MYWREKHLKRGRGTGERERVGKETGEKGEGEGADGSMQTLQLALFKSRHYEELNG